MRMWWTDWQSVIQHLRFGDWLVMALSLLLLAGLWQSRPPVAAQKCQIRLGRTVMGTYDLQQERHIVVQGRQGRSLVHIHHGKVRFEQSPCPNQYCVHQGWLQHAGQVAVCLPNQVSIVLLGEAGFDTLSY